MPLFILFLASAVLAGLGLSLVGDVALMFPQGCLAGLGAFFMAHLAYLVAFTRGGVRLAARPGPFITYARLAFNRFHTPLPASALWVLATYWAAIDPYAHVATMHRRLCVAGAGPCSDELLRPARSAHSYSVCRNRRSESGAL